MQYSPRANNKPSSLLASSLVAMDTTVYSITKMDACPNELMEKVSHSTSNHLLISVPSVKSSRIA